MFTTDTVITRTVTINAPPARVWAALLFLSWGFGFLGNFVWLSKPGETMPAVSWWRMVLQLSFLVGLGVGYRWEIAGAIVILVTSPLYLLFSGPGPDGLAYVVLTAIPAVIWLACGMIESRKDAPPAPPAPDSNDIS